MMPVCEQGSIIHGTDYDDRTWTGCNNTWDRLWCPYVNRVQSYTRQIMMTVCEQGAIIHGPDYDDRMWTGCHHTWARLWWLYLNRVPSYMGQIMMTVCEQGAIIHGPDYDDRMWTGRNQAWARLCTGCADSVSRSWIRTDTGKFCICMLYNRRGPDYIT